MNLKSTPTNWFNFWIINSLMESWGIRLTWLNWKCKLRDAGGDSHVLRTFCWQLPTISDMTHRERNFQLKVEELLSDISNPEYRQTVVEVRTWLKNFIKITNEYQIPDELSRGNVISSHVTVAMTTRQSRFSQVWYFMAVYVISRSWHELVHDMVVWW